VNGIAAAIRKPFGWKRSVQGRFSLPVDHLKGRIAFLLHAILPVFCALLAPKDFDHSAPN